jgi:hypothetical protein
MEKALVIEGGFLRGLMESLSEVSFFLILYIIRCLYYLRILYEVNQLAFLGAGISRVGAGISGAFTISSAITLSPASSITGYFISM